MNDPLSEFTEDMDFLVERELMAALVAFRVNSFSPTACPSPPSSVPYSTSQLRLASTPSSSLQTPHHSVLGHPLKCLYKLLPLMSPALSRTKFNAADHRFYAKSPQL